MKSLFYLTVKAWKNRLLQIIKSPGKFIFYLIVVLGIAALLIFTIISGGQVPDSGEATDMVWLRGIIFAFLLISFIPSIFRGLKQGSTLFQMNDVNFLFVSPLKPQTILLYAIIRTIGATLLGGLFILFQSGGIGNIFGLNFGGLLVIFAGYTLVIVFMQIMTMAIYSYSNGNEARKRIVKIISIILFLPLLVIAGQAFIYAGGDLFAALDVLVNSPVMAWTPILGWVSEGTIAFLTGNLLMGALYYGGILMASAILLIYSYSSSGEYYEDAMAVTETAFEKVRAAQEGQINTITIPDRKTKVARTGLGGIGSKSMFYKHLRESSRQNRTGLWGGFSFILVAGAALFAFLNQEGSIMVILGIFMSLSIFTTGLGRGMKELYSHYIYLIPESPFSKVIWSNLEVIFKTLVETVLAFSIAGVILGESPLFIMSAILIHILFNFVLLGSQYLFMRLIGWQMSPLIQLTVYIFGLALLLAPGIVGAVFAGFLIGDTMGLFAGLMIFAVWELIAALGCFALSKGVLHNCDMLILDTRLTK